MKNASILALLAVFAVACGDNLRPGGADDDGTGPDAAVDATPIDARVCAQRAAGTVGGPCTSDTQCDSAVGAGDGVCFNNLTGPAPWPAQGYCLNRLGTCTTDAQCGTGNVCADIGGFRACMAGCSADPCACPDGMVCSDGYLNTPVQRMVCVPGNTGAIDGATCTTFGDCDEHSICLDDGYENPAGQCMQLGCTIGTDTTCESGGDGHCAMPDLLGGGTGCLDRCTTSADCRTADGYVCYDAGGTIGKFCRHPATGDACAADMDCGVATLWDCRTGALYPGGYCTIQQACNAQTGAGCSPGSSYCWDPDMTGPNPAYCVDRCPGIGSQSTCRTGYTCTDVNPSPTVATGACIFL